MLLGKRIVLLAIFVTAALSPAAQGQTALRYQFKEDDKLRYVLEQQIITTVSVKGKETETKLNVIWDISWNVLKVDRKGGLVQIKIDRARMLLDGPAGKAAADSADKNEPEDALRKNMARAVKVIAAMDLRATLAPTGEVKDVKATEESLKTIKELGGANKEADVLNSDIARSMLFSPVLPADAVVKGKTWSNKTEVKAAFGKTITENTYTYEGLTEKDGVNLEKIAIKPAMKIEPAANAPLKVELKDFKGTGHAWFDNRTGRMIETGTSQRTEMQLEAMGMTFSQTIEQSTTIRLKGK
jgi:hypothetical protein